MTLTLGGWKGRVSDWVRTPESQPSTLRLLAPLGAAYGLAARFRAMTYRRGIARVNWLSTPVLSVGNLTMGGTGKTPIVAALARGLMSEGLRVAVLTRGFGRSGSERLVLGGGRKAGDSLLDARLSGDEPAVLVREAPGLRVVVDANRFEAGRWAESELGVDVFLLDDGFQHMQLGRDLNILTVDATDPFGGGRMPPLGRLREPVSELVRADVAVVTRARGRGECEAVERALRKHACPGLPVVRSWHEPVSLRLLGTARESSVSGIRGTNVGVLTAIGNPAVFLDDVRRQGGNVVCSALFPDHHSFTQRDVDQEMAKAERAGADLVLTTEKDAVKLELLDLPDDRLHAIRIAVCFEPENLLHELSVAAVRAFKSRA